MKIIYIIAVLAVIAFISLVPFDAHDYAPKNIELPNTPDEGVEGVNTHFIHWHAKLDIVIDGTALAIPANVGIKDNEHAVIHTHETDNILHIEQFPNETTMKAGYFFEIWADHINKTVIFNSTCIGVVDAIGVGSLRCNDRDNVVVFAVNGERNEEYENYVMKDEDIIRIEYRKRTDLLQSN